MEAINRETLEEYYTIASRVQAIDEEIRTLYTPRINSGGENIGAGRVSSRMPHSETEETALRIVELKNKLQYERERLLMLAEMIESWLDRVEDPEIEAIVRWHYLLRYNWKITNIKVYGYPDYDYSRKRIARYFERNEDCPNCPNESA